MRMVRQRMRTSSRETTPHTDAAPPASSAQHPAVAAALAAATQPTSGQPLDAAAAAAVRGDSTYDLGSVRIHPDRAASQAAEELDAHAFTIGNHIFVGRDELTPTSRLSLDLLSHELGHVAQQRSGRVSERAILRQPKKKIVRPGQLQLRADAVKAALPALIAGANWKDMRKALYPRHSAAATQRAKERKAGKLVDLTGLGSIASVERIVAGVKTLQGKWTTLKPRARIDAIGALANDAMTKAGLPTFAVIEPVKMFSKGSFNSTYWSFEVNEAQVAAKTLDDEAASLLANTIAHECRHAEQHFTAARYAAGMEKHDSATIQGEVGIPDFIADEAIKKKMDATTDMAVASLGKAMLDDYTAVKPSNQDTYTAGAVEIMDKKVARARRALRAVRRSVTDSTVKSAENAKFELEASTANVETVYAAYRRQPTEADAHEVGDTAVAAFGGWK
jgi:hypothetical protein